ncbi:MAG: outer membrane lipoprotein-sorting protein [Terracidiphilus sp.]
MSALRAAWLAALVPVCCAQAANVSDLLATARKQIETADFRATGHLVSVDAAGGRVSFPVAVKAHWFPGVLRVWVEIGQPPSTHRDMREHILLEMRPNGDNTIRIADPGDAAAHALPFEKWNAHRLGPGFNYEDFLEQQYFWPGQTVQGKARFGARDCDVVRSTPGPNDRTHYSEVKSWIDPTIGFAVYSEKTLKETGVVKEFTSYGLRREQGQWSAHQIQVQTRGQAGSTLLIFDRGSARANLSAADFNPGQLTRF